MCLYYRHYINITLLFRSQITVVNVNTDLGKMIKDNYTLKIMQMEKIIKQWEKRSLSPIGKITLIKTFIIPIFNIFFIALPNPDSVISDQINKTLYDFLWNKKAKIIKTIVVKQYAEGGLKMINLNAFINALKSTWIRRLLTSDSKCQEFIKMHVNLEKLTSFNAEFIRER